MRPSVEILLKSLLLQAALPCAQFAYEAMQPRDVGVELAAVFFVAGDVVRRLLESRLFFCQGLLLDGE